MGKTIETRILRSRKIYHEVRLDTSIREVKHVILRGHVWKFGDSVGVKHFGVLKYGRWILFVLDRKCN